MGLADAMAAPELFQPPIPYFHVATPMPRIAEHMIIRIHRNQLTKNESLGSVIIQRSSGIFRPIHVTRAALQSSGVEETEKEPPRGNKESESDGSASPTQIKLKLHQALQGINRGIFGVPSEKKSEIEALVGLLEAQNPTPAPTSNLEKVDGCWKLVFSTVTILGAKRTKLGLRDFITLGDFLQIINISERKAVNVIKFNVRGLKVLNGQLTVEASFKVASKSRVDITYKTSTITPEQLMNMFRKNYDLLLSIFNPQGWLVISVTDQMKSAPSFTIIRYVDDTLRIGRDDKGNVFLLERS